MTNPLIPKIPSAKRNQDQTNPLIAAANPRRGSNPVIAPSKPNPLIPPPPEQPQDPTALEAVANVLELPKSSVLDSIAGENPFDQWKTPTQSINRVDGKELLKRYDLLDDNDSWKAAVAGFAVDVALDPMTYTGVGALSKGGKAASKAGLLKGQIDSLTEATNKTARQLINEADNADDAMKAFKQAGGLEKHLDQPIKHVLSFAGSDLAKPLAPAIDAATDAIKASAPLRHLRSMFDPNVLNTTSQTAQAIAENRKLALDDALVDVGYRFAEPVRTGDTAVAKTLLDDIAKEAEASGLELSKFEGWASADDISTALANAERLTKASAMSHASQELLGTAAKADAAGIPLPEALKRLGIDTEASRRAVADWAGGKPLDSLYVPPAIVDDAERMLKPIIDPEAIGGVRKAVEDFTRLFKAHVTLPFPSFHFRNLVGGQLQNLILGANRVQDIADDLVSTWKLRKGETPNLSSQIPDFQGLSNEEAAQRLQSELFAHNIAGDWQPGAADVGKIKTDAASRMPGANPLQEAAKPTLDQSINPLDVDNFVATKIGGDVASFVEDMNRISGYIGLRRQGYAPSEAANRIKQLQADYSSATDWEKKYGKNVIPFYLFSKKMLGLTAGELMHHPGGRLAVAVKASAATDRDPSKPHQQRGEASLKLGDNYLSGFGEMHKDAIDAFGSVAKLDPKAVGKQFGGKLNPLIKFPLEQAAQKDLHSGIQLDKMTPGVEQLLGTPIGTTAEHAARNSPFARYLSEAQRLQKKKEAALLKFTTGLNSSE